ncbi:helix-turn-helix domain-containing protein [Crossiella sp. SN42]|nr:helix-turn-helix domain-containing protein [Crossiella sp. SN42]
MAQACGVERSTWARWERGESDPQPWQRTKIAHALRLSLSAVDQLLNASTPHAAARTGMTPSPAFPFVPVPANAETPEPLRGNDIAAIHATMGQLLALDGQCGGTEASRQGLRVFRGIQRRIGAAPCPPALQRDLYAAVGELAEIVGWLLYDANDQDGMRAVSHESLMYSGWAGDRSISLLTHQNLAMHAEWTQRPAEALMIVDRILSGHTLSPRLESLFRARRSHALALQHRPNEARAELARASSLFLDGARDSDPAWAWWVDQRQWQWFTAMVHHLAGDKDIPVTAFAHALAITPAGRQRGRYSYTSYLFGALLEARQWNDAHRLADTLPALITDVGSGSGRTTEILRRTLKKTLHGDVPVSIHDTARELVAAISRTA